MTRSEMFRIALGSMTVGAVGIGFVTALPTLAISIWAIGCALLIGMKAMSTPI